MEYTDDPTADTRIDLGKNFNFQDESLYTRLSRD